MLYSGTIAEHACRTLLAAAYKLRLSAHEAVNVEFRVAINKEAVIMANSRLDQQPA